MAIEKLKLQPPSIAGESAVQQEGLTRISSPDGIVPVTNLPDDIDPVAQWESEDHADLADADGERKEIPTVAGIDKPADDAVAAVATEEAPKEEKLADESVAVAAEETPEAKPKDETAEAKPTGEAKPAEPVTPTYGPDEEIHLSPDVKWTRGQVIKGLQEREQFRPAVQETNKYREIFNMTAAEAEQNWKPLLARLRDNPIDAQMCDRYLADPGLAEYLQRCSEYYDEHPELHTARPATDGPVSRNAKREVPSQESQELQKLRAWQQGEFARQAATRVTNEFADAVRKYPFLGSDPALKDDLMATARGLYQSDADAGVPPDECRGIPAALEIKKSMYEALQIARTQQTDPTPEPKSAVPLLGTSGASPGGTRQQPDNRPKKFASVDDGLDDWVNNPPKEFN